MVERIKKLCLDNKTSIKALEKELGFGNGTIRRWNNNAPSFERIALVANRFNVPVSFITGDDGQKEKLTLQNESELNADYVKLSDTNKAIVDSMIAQLLAAQSND